MKNGCKMGALVQERCLADGRTWRGTEEDLWEDRTTWRDLAAG
jgi:hypothetical protein